MKEYHRVFTNLFTPTGNDLSGGKKPENPEEVFVFLVHSTLGH